MTPSQDPTHLARGHEKKEKREADSPALWLSFPDTSLRWHYPDQVQRSSRDYRDLSARLRELPWSSRLLLSSYHALVLLSTTSRHQATIFHEACSSQGRSHPASHEQAEKEGPPSNDQEGAPRCVERKNYSTGQEMSGGRSAQVKFGNRMSSPTLCPSEHLGHPTPR